VGTAGSESRLVAGPLSYAIPGRDPLAIEHLVLDVNGTLTNRGSLIDGVAERVGALGASIRVHLVSADTFGVLTEIAARLAVESSQISDGEQKAAYVRELGAGRCAAIGNGENDRAMLDAAALGIAVVGPEGAASSAILAADVVCPTILAALDLLLDGRALAATLRR
jgi:P-type E1-E2 ATPase